MDTGYRIPDAGCRVPAPGRLGEVRRALRFPAYHARVRFLLALSTAFLLLAAGELALGWAGRPSVLSPGVRTLALQGWLLEAIAFVAIARLLVGRAGVLLDGLMVGGVVWVLRWPLLALTLAQLQLSTGIAWSPLVRDRLVLNLLVGLVLAWIFRRERADG